MWVLGAVLTFIAVCKASASYHRTVHLQGNNFFDAFDFFTAPDPTQGVVNYVSYATAKQAGIVSEASSHVTFGADHVHKVDSNQGRMSVRLTSKQNFTTGLFVLGLTHMPTGCGTWPAYWLVGPQWPSHGEIDIIEGVDKMTNVQTTLHTNEGCSMANENTSSFTGHWNKDAQGGPATDCYIHSSKQYDNQGCSILSDNGGSMGQPFNNGGGGVYALDWTSSSIRAWFWPWTHVPSDLQRHSPDPSSWGKPYAAFVLNKDTCPASHFSDMNIVFDTTFCGSWDGSAFARDCPGLGNCADYVRNQPGAFLGAYWNVTYLDVYASE